MMEHLEQAIEEIMNSPIYTSRIGTRFTEEYIENLNERIRVRKLVDAERARLRLSKQKHEESEEKSKKVDPLGQLAQFFNAKRL